MKVINTQSTRIGIFALSTLLLLFCSLWALPSGPFSQDEQKPRARKILGIAKENKPISYYVEQSGLWQKLIAEDSSNAEAWHHYYKAERAKLQLSSDGVWANDKQKFYQKLMPILKRAQPHIGNTFEYEYLQGLNSEKEAAIASFEKAYQMDPEREEVYGWLFTHYVPQFAEGKCSDLAQRMLQNNTYSDANLKWNYNALQSVEEGGLIISNGDMDGLPKWVLQYGANIRKDVLVVNKWLMADDDEHRAIVYTKLQLSLPEKQKSEFENLALFADYLAVDLLSRSPRPAYISSGTPLQFFKDNGIEAQMYLVGNALKFSKETFDNTAVIEHNFEQKYYMEYLFQNFQYHPQDEMVKTRMNLTYLPGLIHLKKHYAQTGQHTKKEECVRLIDKIATDSGKKEEVLKWFED